MTMSGYGSFAVPDIETARKFYGETLGMTVDWVAEEGGPVWVRGGGSERTLVYPKPDHTPAVFTVFNIEVPDIGGAVDELTRRGVTFERYDEMDTDERGISRLGDVAAAWFTDPAGNVVALIQMP